MELAAFLARTVAPGGFFNISYNRTPGQKGGFSARMFPEGAHAEAEGFVHWCAKRGWDTYHAQASFKTALPEEKDGRIRYRGERTQANAGQLRSFWVDIDCARLGDKKPASETFPDQSAAVTWLAGFVRATGLPRPNQAVNSGYGLHAYWILEDTLNAQDWRPYAEAFKTLLIAQGFRGDAGLSADSARLLRPPGTLNFKGAQPAPVALIPQLTAGEIPNAIILSVLQPHVVAQPQQVQLHAGSGNSAAAALAGGGGAVTQVFAGRSLNMAAAAMANMPRTARPREMARVATECVQVTQSLANHGAGDPYPLWYLGHLTLAHFCVDGADHVHPISDGDPRYKRTDTDQAVARIAREVTRKGSGPPSCRHYERARPGVCAGCKHFGKIHTPWELGVEDGDLPEGYRRLHGALEDLRVSKGGKTTYWATLLQGDVHSPVLDELPQGGFALSFSYQRRHRQWAVQALGAGLPSDSSAIMRIFEPQGISLLADTELLFRKFLMAWINKLRDMGVERAEIIHPFGWAKGPQGHTGFALAGQLYRPDGTVEAAPGGDREVLAMHIPRGELDEWKRAADFVMAGRPDLQAVVGCAFGAPLMKLTGHSGMVFSFWSKDSGVGKTSASTVAQGVYGSPAAKNSLDDTSNSVFRKAASIRALPIFWDEMRVGGEEVRRFVNMAFSLSQGKEKSRLNADSSMRPVGEWDTILVTLSNRPLIDYMVEHTEGTEAGALRVFEINMDAQGVRPQSARAASIIALAEDNYGRAGAVYAAWLGANHDRAKAVLHQTMDLLTARVGAEQSERLYIAGMACVLTGAAIANKLGLTKFDVGALTDFLCDHFKKLRAARRTAVVVSSKGYDLEQVLSEYMTVNMARKMVTDRFQGSGPKKIDIKWQPQDRQHVDIHISQQDKILRINRASLVEWLRKKGLAPFDVLDSFCKQWGAVVARRVIAGGTGYGSGQLWCLDIPLTRASLQPYLYTLAQQTP